MYEQNALRRNTLNLPSIIALVENILRKKSSWGALRESRRTSAITVPEIDRFVIVRMDI